jgi:hypothetical protein
LQEGAGRVGSPASEEASAVNVVTREDLKELIAPRPGPCVSLFQPTHRAGPDTRTFDQQDPIRFKNLLREAERRLTANGLRAGQARELLAPARRLLDDPVFWQYQADGLALFVAPGFTRTVRAPARFDELVVVTERFHVRPLMRLLGGEGLFYVLALSQNHVRLLAGTRDHMAEVELPGAPRSLAEALQYDDPERQLQFHTGTPATGDRRAAMFHGHGVGIDDSKSNVRRFFQQLDRAVTAAVKNPTVPLVLAGVDYLLPIYREANSHPALLAAGVTGNPEGWRPDELHARAWPLVEPHFLQARRAAAARYRELTGTGRTSNEVRDVLPVAWDGRVEVLFVDVAAAIWGTFVPERRLVDVGEEEPGTEELLNLAAVHTILNRGTVHAVPRADMPDATPLAAIYRF